VQVRLFYGLQVIEIIKLIQLISHKAYYINFRKSKKTNNNKYQMMTCIQCGCSDRQKIKYMKFLSTKAPIEKFESR